MKVCTLPFQSSIHSLEKDEQENSLVWLEDVVGYCNHKNVSKIDELMACQKL